MTPTDPPSTLRRRTFLAGVPAVVATLLLVACGSSGGESGSGDDATAAIRTGPVTTTTVPATVDAEQAPVKVEGDPLPELGKGDDPAIGETAPLITIGALTYVPFAPDSLWSAFTVLPIQIFNWVSRPQADFQDNAAAGIIVLLGLLLLMNAIAIFLRDRYQRRGRV